MPGVARTSRGERAWESGEGTPQATLPPRSEDGGGPQVNTQQKRDSRSFCELAVFTEVTDVLST